MKYLTFALWIVLTGIFLTACTKRSELPTILEVKYDEWTNGPGLRVSLSGEISDGRCPNEGHIDCVWEGEARGVMAAEIGNTVHDISYVIKGLCQQGADPCGNFTDTLGYKFQFLFLSPYPNGVDVPSDYVLSVKVEKN